MKRFVNPFFPRTALRQTVLKTWSGAACKPDPALSRHPSPGGSLRGSPYGEPHLPAPGPPRPCGAIWLARTGGLPGRSLAGYRRWALTPPFQPSPVPEAEGFASFRPSAGLLSAALDVTADLHLTVPRVLSPGGLCYESGLCSMSSGADLSAPRDTATGRPAPDHSLILPYHSSSLRPPRTAFGVGLRSGNKHDPVLHQV